MDENYQEVYFDKYCMTCENIGTKEYEDPCNECLSEPTNVGSHIPVNWEEKEK